MTEDTDGLEGLDPSIAADANAIRDQLIEMQRTFDSRLLFASCLGMASHLGQVMISARIHEPEDIISGFSNAMARALEPAKNKAHVTYVDGGTPVTRQ